MAESVNAIEMSLRQWLSFHKMHKSNCSRAGRSDSIYLHDYKILTTFPMLSKLAYLIRNVSCWILLFWVLQNVPFSRLMLGTCVCIYKIVSIDLGWYDFFGGT